MNICPLCGIELEDDAEVCPICGCNELKPVETKKEVDELELLGETPETKDEAVVDEAEVIEAEVIEAEVTELAPADEKESAEIIVEAEVIEEKPQSAPVVSEITYGGETPVVNVTAPVKQQAPQQVPQYAPQYVPVNRNGNEAVTVGEWMLNMIIMALPIVGIVMLFVWAFGGGTKISLRNFARATLIFALISVVIFAVIAGIALLGMAQYAVY